MLHLASTSKWPQSNSVIERFVQLVIDGVRCLLQRSSMPLRYLTLAARAFCQSKNISLAAFHCETPRKAKHGEHFQRQVILFGSRVTFKPPVHKRAKFALRNEQSLFSSHFLQPGGRWKGKNLVISVEQLIKVAGRIEVKHVCKCALVPGTLTFPPRTVRDIQINEDLREVSELFDQTDPYVEGKLHQWLELDNRGPPTDVDNEYGAKTPIEDQPALLEGSAIEDRESVVRIRLPVSCASSIYTSRIGPPALPKKRKLRDDMQITIQAENLK